MASILPFPMTPILSVASLEAAWREAVLRRDADVLELLLDDQYVYMDPMGDVSGKDYDLRAHRSRAVHIWKMDVLESAIVEHGNVATVQLLVDLQGSFSGAPFGGHYRYLRTWALKSGGWRLIAGVTTEVPPPSDI